MDVNQDVLNMPKGWVVSYEDGRIITQYDCEGNELNWRKVPKRGIKSLTLKWHNKHWTVAGKECYLQYRRAWVSPLQGERATPNIEYRCIGYWEGNDKVIYKVDELTGEMKIHVETISKPEGK